MQFAASWNDTTLVDHYKWRDADCLQNKLGLRDPEELRIAEARIVAIRDVEALRSPIPGYFNLDHLQRVHRHLFKDVYEWAGETRNVDIHKPGATFCHWRQVDEFTSALLSRLDSEQYLHGRNRQTFLDRFAYYYGELNAYHPFREGNGRTQRVFLRQLAVGAGWKVDWSGLSEQENIEASRRNLVSASTQELAELFDPLISRI